MDIVITCRLRRNLASIAATTLALLCTFPVVPSHAAEPSDLWHRDKLTGDWGGTRTDLSDQGIDIGIADIAETLNILSGGFRQGTTFAHLFNLSLDTNLDKLAGWSGATAHLTFYQIGRAHGMPAADYIGSIADSSNIEALPAARLFTAWFQQNLLDDKLSIRVGQIAADDEFFTSPTAGGLIASTFGFATFLAANQNQGGPVYPLATPGIRVQVQPTDEISILEAVFGGAPSGANCTRLPQQCNRYGLKFPTDGSLWMGEAQYAANQGGKAMGLPGVYKLGGWYATTDFTDQHFGLNGAGATVSLADPTSVSSLNHRGDWGFYGVADQMIWRAVNGPQSVNIFLRAGGSPSDRNLVSSYIDGGVGIKAPIPGHDDDVLTLGIAYSKISSDAAALDADTQVFTGYFYPIRDKEIVYEIDYSLQIAPWLALQTDVQYVADPSGNVPNPVNPAESIPNALVLAFRSKITF